MRVRPRGLSPPGGLLDAGAEPVDLGDAAATSAAAVPSSDPSVSASPSAEPSPTAEPVGGVYAATVSGELDPRVADVPERVYVPNEESDDVAVIDPATFEVVGRFAVGDAPEHVNPDWGLENLYVSNMNGGSLTVIDPMTSEPTDTHRPADLPVCALLHARW